MKGNGQGRKIICKKQRLKSVFISKRKEFDKAVRKAKRKFKKTNDDDLIKFQTKDQREFWRKEGSIGVANERQSLIPMQVETDNGDINDNIPTVLDKWESDFSNLLNMPEDNLAESINLEPHPEIVPPMTYDVGMNGILTFEEMQKMIRKAKCNKAPGFDEIPMDILKNDSACFFLT